MADLVGFKWLVEELLPRFLDGQINLMSDRRNLSNQRHRELIEATRALGTALITTKSYCHNGALPRKTNNAKQGEARIAQLWQDAAVAVAPIDENVSDSIQLKADYWAENSRFRDYMPPDAERRIAFGQIESHLDKLREMLNRPTKP